MSGPAITRQDVGARQTGIEGVFVTGTGTEVGKTVVAAVLARTLAAKGGSVAVFKPAVSGLDDYAGGGERAGEEPDHVLLRRAARSTQTDDEVAPYRFGPAVSPHLAAEIEGEPIDRQRLIEAACAAAQSADALVCEGVGGFLVPLTPDYLVRDFARDLGLPVVVAAPPGLGTINHTLLTLEAVCAADLEVDAVVLTPWPESPSLVERSNRETIAQLGQVRVEAIPPLDLDRPQSWPRCLAGLEVAKRSAHPIGFAQMASSER